MAAESKNTDRKYNRLKSYKGSRYSGMKVGGRHKWYYDKGEWREQKVRPEEWDIYYQTTKRRAGKAPVGSGAPVGTQYNWLIVSHQRVDKLDANSYMTRMEGKKFKVAHKRSGKDKWSITEKTQRKKVIRFLEQLIDELKKADNDEQIPYTTGTEERIYGLRLRNKSELYEMAGEQKIPGRSRMNRQELLEAVENSHNGQVKEEKPEKTATSEKLREKTRDDLYQMAVERSIKGRSEMKKAELVKALKKFERREPANA